MPQKPIGVLHDAVDGLIFRSLDMQIGSIHSDLLASRMSPKALVKKRNTGLLALYLHNREQTNGL
jgi:hypothetical protein